LTLSSSHGTAHRPHRPHRAPAADNRTVRTRLRRPAGHINGLWACPLWDAAQRLSSHPSRSAIRARLKPQLRRPLQRQPVLRLVEPATAAAAAAAATAPTLARLWAVLLAVLLAASQCSRVSSSRWCTSPSADSRNRPTVAVRRAGRHHPPRKRSINSNCPTITWDILRTHPRPCTGPTATFRRRKTTTDSLRNPRCRNSWGTRAASFQRNVLIRQRRRPLRSSRCGKNQRESPGLRFSHHPHLEPLFISSWS
jgi:hypothetical protein